MALENTPIERHDLVTGRHLNIQKFILISPVSNPISSKKLTHSKGNLERRFHEPPHHHYLLNP